MPKCSYIKVLSLAFMDGELDLVVLEDGKSENENLRLGSHHYKR